MKMYDNFFCCIKPLRHYLVAMQVCCAQASATSYPMADITELSTQWLNQQLATSQDIEQEVQLYPLDHRLPAKHCDAPLEFSLVAGKIQRQNTIRVLCPDEPGWQLFLSAKVSQMMSTVIARRQIPAGSLIDGDMLQINRVELNQTRGRLVQDPQLIVGARVKRSLQPGQILTQHDLCLVCKGDVVTIEGISTGLSVTTQATALQDGTLGESVKVQNNQSNRVIKAEIVAVKRVAIKL